MLKRTGLSTALFAGMIAAAAAQTDYPSKPVTIIVPYSAGGPSDVVTRVLAEELERVWQQPVIIDNKPGGGTIVGVSAAQGAAPDGYTMVMISRAFVVNPAVRDNLPYDPANFQGVSIFVDSPQAIVAHPGFAPDNLVELVAEAKKNPDEPLTYAIASVGGSSHLTGELLKARTGINLEAVPYAGAAEALPDVLSGRVDFQIGSWSDQRPNVDAGKLKLITVLYSERIPDLPDRPTAREEVAEMASAPMGAFNGIAVPKGVPEDVMAKIAAGFEEALSSESFKQRILDLGAYPAAYSPAETDAFLEAEATEWREIATTAGIKLE